MTPKKLMTGVLLTLAGFGCSGPDDRLDEVASELVAWDGVGNTESVSRFSTDWTSTAWQSEVAAAVSTDFHLQGAFNAEDTNTAHVTYPVRTERDSSNRFYVDRIVCPGTSQVGRFLYDGSQWNALRLPTPNGWAVVWGDPAAAAWEGNLWISALGSPTDVFSAKSNTTVNGKGCYRTSDYPSSGLPVGFGDDGTTPLAGAVVQAITSNTLNAPNAVVSFRRNNGVDSATGTDFLDGGSMVACGGALYAAYEDTKTHTLAMYRKPANGGAWAPVAGDSSITTKDHPLLFSSMSYTGTWVLTANGGTLTRRSHTSAGFAAPLVVASDYSSSNVVLKGGASIRRGRAYAAVVAPNPNALSPASWIAYERVSGTAKQIALIRCTSASCTLWATFGGTDPRNNTVTNAFMPAVALAYHLVNGVSTPVLGVTYLTDKGLTGNQVFLAHSDYSIPGGSNISSGPLTKPQVACPGSGADYIGDYDAMVVTNNATDSADFNRFITDFTETTCDTTTRANLDYRSQDQHVSNVWYHVP